jgi:hypothetical protein
VVVKKQSSFFNEQKEKQPSTGITRSGKTVELADTDIQWDSYVRQVQLYFNRQQIDRFNHAAEILTARFKTKNITDTVFQAMIELAFSKKFTAADQICQDCDGTNKDLCSSPERCPKHAKN